jgi:hypothetical protein
MRPFASGLTSAALAALLAAGGPARAADDAPKLDTSLNHVPADAAFYSSSLRLGEQVKAFLASNAYAKLRALPAAKAAAEHLHAELAKPDAPVAPVIAFFHDPANRELTDLLLALGRREVVVYGGAGWADFATLLLEANGAMRFAPAQAALSGKFGPEANKAQAEAVLRVLSASADKLRVPELVLGFRLDNAAPATAQIKRLEDLLKPLSDQEPQLKGRVKRVAVGGGAEALTLTLDGGMVPWDQIPVDEDFKDDVKALFAKLKTLKLTVSLVAKNDFLLLGIGPDAGAVEKFGRGPALATRSEFRPLAQFRDKPLVAVNYTSAALAAAVATTPEDVTGIATALKGFLGKAPISDDRRKAIEKDVDDLAQQLAATLPRPGASMGFAFLTPRGMEGYAYDYTTPRAIESKPLTILDHVGGSPLMAAAARVGAGTSAYKTLVKWLKTIYGHAEAVVGELLGEAQQQQIQTAVQLVLPHLKKFDEITATMLLPALADGQMALVVDAKWTSKHWFPELDQGGQELPMLELGCVHSVSDSALLLRAFRSYRELVNDVLAQARQFGAQVPEDLPKAQTKKVGPGMAYYWPVPEMGQDAQVQPNVALSEGVLAATLSLAHSERLLKPTPLAGDGGPLADKRPLLAASVVDFGGVLRAARPWVEKFAIPALAEVAEDAPPGLTRKELPGQVRTLLDVLQVFRGYRSATYREGNATVTHSETVIQDLK